MYKAIFFDRDGTLTYFNKEKENWRNEIISKWSGKEFEITYEKMMSLFKLAGEGKKPWYKNLEDERNFFRRYYKYLIIGEGISEDIDKKADILFNELWCNGDRKLFHEVIEVLEYFKEHNFKMGVISDTSPSLKYTLEQLGISDYFTSFTASSIVGVGKPNPLIYNSALKEQNITAQESIYVDDTPEEADGARELGFTSFYLDRNKENIGEWIINDLRELIDFVKKQ